MCFYPAGIDRPEQKLLFCCARRRLEEEHGAEIKRLLAGELDWEWIWERARQHKLLAFLHLHLTDFSCHIPHHIKSKLSEQFSSQSRQNLRLMGEIVRVTRLLKVQGIEAVAYKGPILSHLAYGEVALRSCVDLDFLVRAQDLPRAEQALVKNGYNRGRQFGLDVPVNVKLANSARASWLKLLDYEHPFVNNSGGFFVELHWALAPRKYAFRLSADKMWRRRVPSELTASIQTLCPEDLLIALSNHGNRHIWKRLEWIANFAEVAVRYHEILDWPHVLHVTRQAGTQRMLLVALLLAQDLGQLKPHSLPEKVAQVMARDQTAAALRDQIWRDLLIARQVPQVSEYAVEREAEDAEIPAWQRVIFMMRMRERRQDSLVYALREFCTSTFLWIDAVLQDVYARQIPKWRVPPFFVWRFVSDAWIFALYMSKSRQSAVPDS